MLLAGPGESIELECSTGVLSLRVNVLYLMVTSDEPGMPTSRGGIVYVRIFDKDIIGAQKCHAFIAGLRIDAAVRDIAVRAVDLDVPEHDVIDIVDGARIRIARIQVGLGIEIASILKP